jgi:AcrR family transcriptional regulator
MSRQQRSERTRDDILQCALELFSTRGYSAVSLRDIAQKVGINHGMIRYHFGNKESLWRQSATFLFIRLAEELPAPDLCDAKNQRTALKQFVVDYVHYCARHPEHSRLMVQESILGSDRLRWVCHQFIRPNHQQTLELINETGIPARLVGVDPVMLLYMVVSLAQMPYLVTAELHFSHHRNVLTRAAIEAHAQAVVAFIFRD